MQSHPPEITVAVSTKGRAHRLPRLLEALEGQTLPADRFEVVIVDNGSKDDTTKVLEGLAAGTPITLRHRRLEGNNGPAVGRNAAWREARGRIVAFTDDDCYPLPDWLTHGLKAMNEHDVVVGRTQPDPDQAHELGPFARTVSVDNARYFQTCNVFYRRGDLETVNGFDEGFPTPAGEDTDVGMRVRALGRSVAFSPEAVVYHDVRRSSFREAVKVTLRWGGLARVIKKHPVEGRELLYRRIFWKRSHPHVLLAALGLMGSLLFPPSVLLIIPWLNYRAHTAPLTPGPTRYLVLPGAFVIDLLEVYVMARGSLQHGALIL